MSVINKQLREAWDALRAERPRYAHFLTRINIGKMRGIGNLDIPFGYPVTVLAGENACGKSTVLFACAAAYKDPDAAPTDYSKSPATLFPNYTEEGADAMQGAEIGYTYISQGQDMRMKWKRGKSWNRSFYGLKRATQPERKVYLRTLASLTNPSEVRSMLQMRHRNPRVSEVPAETLLLSRRVLPFQYENVRKVEKGTGKGDLLLAKLEQGRGEYSEFHMASGERSILRLSMEIAELKDALVLIDEVETGLHPYIQKLLMLNLQSIAKRQNLQVIVTTHSPVVLDCVPPEGRVFLERDKKSHDVREAKHLRDTMQKIMYGQVDDKLSIICEDVIAEAVIRGVVEAISGRINFAFGHVFVGRDTGKSAFPHHVRTMAMMGKLSDVVFVLDGDGKDKKDAVEKAAEGATAQVLALPGDKSPEEWLWREMRAHSDACGHLLSIPELSEHMDQAEREIGSGVGKEKHKAYLHALSEIPQCEPADIARRVTRHLVEERKGEIVRFSRELEEKIQKWRSAAA